MERLPRDSLPVGRSSNLIYKIWVVGGGFILHFLLCNFLTVLLRPSYEEPVETAEDLIRRDITPILWPAAGIYIQFFADSPDPIYKQISKRFVITKDKDEYVDKMQKLLDTGMYARMGSVPWYFESTDDYKYWYRSSETISGLYQYLVHLSNKKWPLKEVL